MRFSDIKELVIKNKHKLSYININDNNLYTGWVSDFHLKYKPKNIQLKLNLKKESDLFLLFVLASSWSKTGPWENALFFVSLSKDKL